MVTVYKENISKTLHNKEQTLTMHCIQKVISLLSILDLYFEYHL